MYKSFSRADQSDRSFDAQKQVGNRKSLIFSGAASFLATGCLCFLLFLDDESSSRLTKEDGIVENMTAAAFLASALVCAFLLGTRISCHRTCLMLWLFLSAIFFGEEISWGQRVVKYSTPQILSSNVQAEANLHNLPFWSPQVIRSPSELLTSQGLFYMGFLTYFFVMPISQRFGPFQKILGRIGFTAPPTAVLILLWIPILLSFALAFWISYGPVRDALCETREMCFAFAILSYVLCLASPDPAQVNCQSDLTTV